MNIARKIAIAVVTATLSVGLLGISAPANADTGWPYRTTTGGGGR